MARIMVVDDAAFMRKKCASMLVADGHEVLEASNGVEAVESYKNNQPDMVLMDVTMPEMDGVTALKEIKKLDPNAKITMVTAMGQQAVVMEALKAGALDFVVKPFDPDRIQAAIKKMAG